MDQPTVQTRMSNRKMSIPLSVLLWWWCSNYLIFLLCCIDNVVPVQSRGTSSLKNVDAEQLLYTIEDGAGPGVEARAGAESHSDEIDAAEELEKFWGRVMVDGMSMSMSGGSSDDINDAGTTATPPPETSTGGCSGTSSSSSSSPLSMLFIGNSFTGGSGVGRACLDDDSNRPGCEDKAVPGHIRTFVTTDPSAYPGQFDHPPAQDTLVDPAQPYHPFDNPNVADVPSKINAFANYFCTPIVYDQNTQSAFTTRSHAGQAGANPQSGTIRLLNETTPSTYDLVFIQPQSTEYLDGARSSRVDALQLLTSLAIQGQSPVKTTVVVQQTWPRRESTTYNQICDTTEDVTNEDGTVEEVVKEGMLDRIDDTLADLAEEVTVPFTVAPTGVAFVEFAKLACGDKILPNDECAFDTDVDCPIWFGEGTRTSLFAENTTVEGFHQSGDVGAWLSATVLYGVVHSAINNGTACYVSEKDLDAIFPSPPLDLVDIPSGDSIPYLISKASRSALDSRFSTVKECEPA